jgi:hypothetical protein
MRNELIWKEGTRVHTRAHAATHGHTCGHTCENTHGRHALNKMPSPHAPPRERRRLGLDLWPAHEPPALVALVVARVADRVRLVAVAADLGQLHIVLGAVVADDLPAQVAVVPEQKDPELRALEGWG